MNAVVIQNILFLPDVEVFEEEQLVREVRRALNAAAYSGLFDECDHPMVQVHEDASETCVLCLAPVPSVDLGPRRLA